MLRITLFCNAGMSTSLLVKKMMDIAKEEGIECHVEAYSTSEAADKGIESDVILLGPQVRHELKAISEMFPNTPIAPIDMMSYGMMDAKAVLTQALNLLRDN